MVTDFLTDFYNFVKPTGVSLTDFIHGVGKTSGFDGMYGVYDTNKTDYFDKLYAKDNKTVDASTGMFINQPEYNKWVPLLDVLEEYTNLGIDDKGVQQTFWGSPWTGARRIVPFMQAENLWGSDVASDVEAITSKIPEALKSSIPGVSIEVPTTYKQTDEVILPKPEKANDEFIGWYDNANLYGTAITKIEKGSTGNKTFYARYASSDVVDPTLTDQQKLSLAMADIKITYASGDNKDNVTKNITLPKTGLHGATITWNSSDTSTINVSGNVVRKTINTTVTLTATVKVGTLTDTLEFNLIVIEKEAEPEFYTITFNLNGGEFIISGFKNKSELAEAFLTDLYNFVKPSENLTTFMHGAGKNSGFNGTWYSNEEYRAKIYGANIKSGNNNYFLSHSSYQAKWKPLADFMVSFVKVGNAEQDYWSSPYTGNKRLMEYFANKKPGEAWTDADMAKMPTGLSSTTIPEKYTEQTPTITLPEVKRNGYEFVGWYTANTGGTKVSSIAKGSTGNKTFYARWEEVTAWTITYHLNGGAFGGYTNKNTLANDFLTDLYNFVKPSENLTTFMHGAGKSSGFNGTWYSNEEYRAKIYGKNIKSGNNNYFLSHSSYQAKWKPLADFMDSFVKVGNAEQDFWSSPYTGNLRLNQYFTNVKPGDAWSDADMAKLPTGLSASVYYEYNANSPSISLPTPTRSGFTFEGWYTANTGGTKVSSIAKGETGNKVFYARWKEVADQGIIDLMNLLKAGHNNTLNKHTLTYYGGKNYSKAQYKLVNRFLFEPLSINTTSYVLPTSKVNHPNSTAEKHWVVIHDTGNTEANAKTNAQFMLNTTQTVSWHYTVGNDGTYRSMAENYRAYHAGDGSSYSVFANTGIPATNPYLRPKMTIINGNFAINGTRTNVKAPGTASQLPQTGLHPVIINGTYHINDTRVRYNQASAGRIGFDGGNVNGIAIESSVYKNDHLWWTWGKTAKLTADILVRRGLLPDRVVFHNTFDGKMCPQTAMRNNQIDEWLEMIFLEYKVRRYYSNYQISFTSHSSILNNVGRITTLPTSNTNVSYTITIKAPNGTTISERLTTTVRA